MKDGEELHGLVGHVMALTNVPFFSLLGASLKLPALVDTLWVALAIFAVRIAAIVGGSWAGCTLSGTGGEFRRLFWLSMITQAGVAMGLARIVATKFPTWGPNFQTLMFSIIMLNMLAGPSMFRAALLLTGEARSGGGLSKVGSLGRRESGPKQFGSPDAVASGESAVHIIDSPKGLADRH